MQKIATRVFIYSSILFGIIGIAVVFTIPGDGSGATLDGFHIVLMKLLFATVIIILTSFALSVAGKYLKD
jgi:hypothetical protein